MGQGLPGLFFDDPVAPERTSPSGHAVNPSMGARCSHPWLQTVSDAPRIAARRLGGRGSFGGTQATVMALKALTSWARSNAKALREGEIRVKFNGGEGDGLVTRPLPGLEKRTITLDLTEQLIVIDQETRQQIVTQMIGLHDTFMSVLGYFLLSHHETCIVDQDINLVIVVVQPCRCLTDRFVVAQIKILKSLLLKRECCLAGVELVAC